MDRPSSSSSSVAQLLPRACLVLPVSDVVDDFQCHMYIIDLNYREDAQHTVQQTRKIHISGEFFRNTALCVVGWTLFVFVGHSDDEYARSRSIYQYALNPNTEYESLAKRSLTRCGNMKCIKLFPTTILTPRADKIVVFSTSIHSYPQDRCDFELFDICSGKCIKLPRLHLWKNLTAYEDDSCLVQYYSFINDSVMLVQTTRGMHVIDLGKYLTNDQTSEESTWRPYRFPVRGVLNMPTSFQFIGEEGDFGEGICLTPFCAYDFGIGNSRCNWFYKYPHPSLSSDEAGTYHIIPLDVTDPSNSTFCAFSVTMEEDYGGQRWTPLVTMHVYKCDVRGCKREFILTRQHETNSALLLPQTVHINSLKIRLELQPSNCMYVRHSSTIPDSLPSNPTAAVPTSFDSQC